jgi:hypothetical protein
MMYLGRRISIIAFLILNHTFWIAVECADVDSSTTQATDTPITRVSIPANQARQATSLTIPQSTSIWNLNQARSAASVTTSKSIASNSPTPVPITTTKTLTPRWGPIPQSILSSQGSCPVSNAPVATGTSAAVPGGLNAVLKTSDGNRNEAEKAKTVAVGVVAGMMAAWVVMQVFVEACVGLPFVDLEGVVLGGIAF